jgi:CHASE2 domain-containing sensor protein
MRRVISLVLALTLFFAGTFALGYLLLFAAGWKGWMVIAAAMMGVVGAMWLYSDFIDATPNDQRKVG